MITATQVKHYADDKIRIEFWCETALQNAIMERVKSNSELNSIELYFVDLPDCYINEDMQIDILAEYVQKWGYTVKVVHTDESSDGHISATISW